MSTFDDTTTLSLLAPRPVNGSSVYAQDTTIKSADFPLLPSEARDENRAGDLTAWEDTKFRIKQYENLEADWDGEDAEPIAQETIAFTLSLLQRAYDQAKSVNLDWQPCDVAPDADGRVDLLWMVNEKSPREQWLNMLISEAKRDAIVAIKKTAPNAPERFVLSQQQAIEAILWILAVKP